MYSTTSPNLLLSVLHGSSVLSALATVMLTNNTNTNINRKPSQNLNQDKKTFENNTTPPIKNPAKPPIQLIAKPKNINNNVRSNESSQNISSAGNKRRLSNKPDQNTNKPKAKNFNHRKNTPELVGAPIRREELNQQKNNNKQNRPQAKI